MLKLIKYIERKGEIEGDEELEIKGRSRVIGVAGTDIEEVIYRRTT